MRIIIILFLVSLILVNSVDATMTSRYFITNTSLGIDQLGLFNLSVGGTVTSSVNTDLDANFTDKGTTGYFQISGISIVTNISSFTIGGWHYVNTINDSSYPFVISSHTYPTVSIRINLENIYAGMGSVGFNEVCGDLKQYINLSEPFHMVLKGNGTFTDFYINKELVCTKNYAYGLGANSQFGRYRTVASNVLSGYYDWRFYNETLTESEIFAWYDEYFLSVINITNIDINVNKSIVYTDEIFYWNASYLPLDATNVSVLVDFGDGTNSSMFNGTKSYSTAGNYNITIIATDLQNNSVSDWELIEVNSIPPIINIINISPELSITRFASYKIVTNITNTTPLNNITVTYNTINGEGIKCWNYYTNGTCDYRYYQNLSMTYNNLTGLWEKIIYPDNIYPELYFTNSNITFYNQPDNTIINRNSYHIFNMTNPFKIVNGTAFFLEFNIEPLPANNVLPLQIYLIQNNITDYSFFETDWINRAESYLVGSFNRNQNVNHIHNENSSHYLLPLTTDNNGLIEGINISDNFMIVLYVNTPDNSRGWNLRYRNESLCDNQNNWKIGSRIGNDWNTPIDTIGCPDFHIHFLRGYEGIRDGLNATIIATYDTTETIISTTEFYYTPLPNLPPNPTSFIIPEEFKNYTLTTNDVLNISWNPSSDPNNDIIYYTLKLYNSMGGLVDILASNITNTYYEWNTQNYNLVDYELVLYSCDYELCSNFSSGLFYINNFKPNVGDETYYPPTPPPIVLAEVDLTKKVCDISIIPQKIILDNDNKQAEVRIINRESSNYTPIFVLQDVYGKSSIKNSVLINDNGIGTLSSNQEKILVLKYNQDFFERQIIIGGAELKLVSTNCRDIIISIDMNITSDSKLDELISGEEPIMNRITSFVGSNISENQNLSWLRVWMLIIFIGILFGALFWNNIFADNPLINLIIKIILWLFIVVFMTAIIIFIIRMLVGGL